jgi:hypothetical protein
MDKETQKNTRYRMQKKENAPCNNQPIRAKDQAPKKWVQKRQGLKKKTLSRNRSPSPNPNLRLPSNAYSGGPLFVHDHIFDTIFPVPNIIVRGGGPHTDFRTPQNLQIQNKFLKVTPGPVHIHFNQHGPITGILSGSIPIRDNGTARLGLVTTTKRWENTTMAPDNTKAVGLLDMCSSSMGGKVGFQMRIILLNTE